MKNTTQDDVTIISVQDVSKRFTLRSDKSLKERLLHPRRSRDNSKDFWALKNVSLDIQAGHTIGLIGANGSGKSTLLKTIGGILSPSSGQVLQRGRLAALLELGAGFHPDLTGRENIYLNASILGLSREETDACFDDIVAFSGIENFIDTQVKFYSSGMYVRLAFAVAIHVKADILLVDEVLAVGDIEFQHKCLTKIREFQERGGTIIIVTHSLDQIQNFCTRAVVLESGKIIFDGDPTQAVEILENGILDADELERRKKQKQAERQTATKIEKFTKTISDTSYQIQPEKIVPGSDITIDVQLTSAVKHTDLTAELVINIGYNELVRVSTYGPDKRLFDLHPGTNHIRYTLPDLRIGAGKYYVDLSLWDTDGEVLYHYDGITLEVQGDNTNRGALYTDPKVEITHE